ncbi:MAG: hypothetical protein Ct9H300mP15_02120 [Gemmatimonadota bacterium]|nr:MAG: hypothetical protein Ct9H300mP15_02120 [Gemmatimonadota bacterium]
MDLMRVGDLMAMVNAGLNATSALALSQATASSANDHSMLTVERWLSQSPLRRFSWYSISLG